MSARSSSSVEAESPRGWIMVGSTDPELIARNIGIVPLSAETLRAAGADIPLARPEYFRAVLEKYVADTDAAAGMVTCRYAEGRTSLIFESPTLRLSTDAFQLPGFFGDISAEWLIGDRSFACRRVSSPASMTVRVVGLRTTAQPIVPAARALLNSTDRTLGASRLVESKFEEASALAGKEWFEDGVESEFSRAVSTLLHTYGDAAVAPVETLLRSPNTNVEVAVEAAQWLGKVDHPASHRYRKTLLEKVLLSEFSTRLRHGAAAGLAAMDDPASLPALVEAHDHETNQRLRHFLRLVVDQLERTRACRSS